MSDQHHNILNVLKQIPFLLVLCAILLQPVAETFSVFSDTSIEFADFDDDAEEEVEDKTEKDTKIKSRPIHSTIAHCDHSNNSANQHLQLSRWSCNLEILIPPPRQA